MHLQKYFAAIEVKNIFCKSILDACNITERMKLVALGTIKRCFSKSVFFLNSSAKNLADISEKTFEELFNIVIAETRKTVLHKFQVQWKPDFVEQIHNFFKIIQVPKNV